MINNRNNDSLIYYISNDFLSALIYGGFYMDVYKRIVNVKLFCNCVCEIGLINFSGV